MRGYGRNALLMSSAIMCVVATPAAAQTKSFDVPAQSAQSAIRQLGRQADVQIIAARKVTQGKQTKSVRGNMTVEQALEMMFAGTGLVARPTGAGAWTIVPLASASAASGAQAGRGQAILIGSVRDHATGAALKGARVEVVETGDATSTGNLGDFRFAGLPAGDATLRVSYLGFPEQTETVSVVGGLTNRTDIYLGSGATSEIVVIGQVSARAQALNQERAAENSSTVISSDLLGQFNGNTISDALRRAPGIAFQQSSDTGDGTNVIVRGLAPDYNQVKLNGINLPEGSGLGRSANLSNILSESISEVRISKTLLANQDSAGTGGLIEIETKSPLDRPKRFASVSAEGTKRGKGFGKDYQVAGTLSARFGAEGNFGVSVSAQYRDQDLATYAYQLSGGFPGAYLPLASNGEPATFEDLDPRTAFPFVEGSDYLFNSAEVSRNLTRSKTFNLTLSTEWQVSDATNLRFDYVRSDRKSDLLRQSFTVRSGFGGYHSLQPVPAEGAAERYVYSDLLNLLGTGQFSSYAPGLKETTDTLSFRGESSLGRLTLNYRAGYAKGASARPHEYILQSGRSVPIGPDTLLPEAINPATGTAVNFFGPRTGRGFPVPLISDAAYDDLLNAPTPRFFYASDSPDTRGGSTNLSFYADAKYEFGGGILRYVHAGIDFKRSKFDSDQARTVGYQGVRDPDTGLPPLITDYDLAFEQVPFGAVGGRGSLYRFLTVPSLVGFFGGIDRLVEDGRAERFEDPIDTVLADQYTRESDVAGFVQARADIGKLEIIGGVRFNRVKTSAAFANGIFIYDADGVFDQDFYNQTRTLITESASVTTFLPRILANFRPREDIVIRAGYFSSIARPQIQLLSTQQLISYDAQPYSGPTGTQPLLSIQRGNPGLKPARTHNFDVGAEWYDGKVGVLKLNLFYKRIDNLLESNTSFGSDALDGIDLPSHPLLDALPANVLIQNIYPVNASDPAKIWGFEAAAERRLAFLPGALSGLGIYANYVYTKSRKTLTSNWSTAPVYDNGVLVDREVISYQERVPFDQSPRHSGTLGLTYASKVFDASLYYTMQSRRVLNQAAFDLDVYNEAVRTLDFRGEYRFALGGAQLRLSLEGLNLLKGRRDANIETSVGGSGSVPKYYSSGNYFGGRSFALGLSATF